MGLPTIRRTELSNYAGERVTCDLAAPRDADELAEVFAHCRALGRVATLRGNGFSLDGQALNRDLVISLEHFHGLEVDKTSARARAGVATTWGDVFTEARRHGCMPRVLVTNGATTVGGTVASNSLSRFTPVRGKEIRHVARLDLITSRGQALSCGPDLDPEVFAGVVGGFGYLGAVTRVDVALDKGAPEAVQTEIIGLLPLADVLAGLRATTSGAADMWTPTRYAVLLPGLARGFLFESSYLARATRWRRYWPVHAPRSLGHLLTQVLLRNGTLSRLTWSLSTQVWSRRPYVDPIHDFTFMMNGNVRLVRLGRRTGRAMGCAQQTFIVPLGVAPVQPAAAATEFLGHARDIFARHRLTPALTDVLSVPADDGILSSSAKLDGLAITFGFETSRRAELACIRDAFRKLATICGRLGGRVHLVKNVVADPAVLASMYAEAIPRFRALKERLDPDHVLRNDFLRTHFPALAGP